MSFGPPSWTISPSRITAILSESVSASNWSCVTNSVVMFSRSVSVFNSTRMSSRSFASRLDSGSSSRSAFGCRTSARASASRCCWPPLSCGAGRRSSPSNRTRLNASSTRSRTSALGSLPLPCEMGNATLS